MLKIINALIYYFSILLYNNFYSLFYIYKGDPMKLAYWMYAGPAHIGTLRVASSFKNVHAIMHAPLGDDYFV